MKTLIIEIRFNDSEGLLKTLSDVTDQMNRIGETINHVESVGITKDNWSIELESEDENEPEQ